MKVIVADTAGFCKGVKDALEVTLEAIQEREDGENICTFGPLIHNRQVLEMLEGKGIREENRLENCADKKVVIRAHGIPPHERQSLHKLNATLLDATCKRVARVHAVIKRHARRGYHTVIVGDADHAEVIGLMGYTEGRGVVINRPQAVERLPHEWENVLLVAQTTQNEEVFNQIREAFLRRYPHGVVKKTICDSTHERQTEVRRLCSGVEAMVVVGGYHSGNTVRLAEVARECGVPTYHVETEADLNDQEMARYSTVGVSAGASTPNWIIQDVVCFLESIRPESPDTRLKIRRLVELLAYGNIHVALGAAFLTAVVQAMTGLAISFQHLVMAALYVYAMHSLNFYMDRNATELNNPGRAVFHQRWRQLFTWTSAFAVLFTLGFAWKEGFWTFVVMGLLIAVGTLYAAPMPSSLQNFPGLKIKEIPTSKTFFIPVGWASVIVLVPLLPHLFDAFGRVVYAFWVVFLLVLIRTALLDFLAVRGDRLVAKETLVVLVGETVAARITAAVLAILGLTLVIGPAIGLSTGFAYLALPVIVPYGWCLVTYSKNRYREGSIFESIIESVLVALGLLASMWNLVV